MKRVLLIAGMLIGLASAAPADDGFCFEQGVLNFDYLQSTTSQSVGGAVVTFKLGEQPCFFFFGEIEKGKGTTPDADTVFELASITKVFTTAILGTHIPLGLDVYVPVKPDLPPDFDLTTEEQGVTYQQLATFTGGFSWSDPDDFTKGKPFTQDQFVDDVNGLVPDDTIPGESNLPTFYKYSNGSVGLLGQVLMNRDSKNGPTYSLDANGFSNWISDNLTGPLNMPHTRVHPRGTVATGYKLAKSGPKKGQYIVPVDSPFPWVPWGAAGALRSTTADMLTFLEANICAHHMDDPGCASFPSYVLDALSTAHNPNYYQPQGNLADPIIYAGACGSQNEQGWAWKYVAPPAINPNNEKPMIIKDGGHPGFSTWIGFSPDKAYGLVILLNTGNISLGNAGKDMIEHTNWP